MITQEQFDRIDNCRESLAYVARQPSLTAAWNNCERPDWLLAFARKSGIATKAQFVRVAIGEAEAVLHIWTDKYPDDDRAQRAIQVAKGWLGDQTSVTRAARAAYAAYAARSANAAARYASYADASSGADAASSAASSAADAARAASSSSASSSSAAASAAAGAAGADDTDDKVAFVRAQCDRIRAIIPNPFIDHEGDKQ